MQKRQKSSLHPPGCLAEQLHHLVLKVFLALLAVLRVRHAADDRLAAVHRLEAVRRVVQELVEEAVNLAEPGWPGGASLVWWWRCLYSLHQRVAVSPVGAAGGEAKSL